VQALQEQAQLALQARLELDRPERGQREEEHQDLEVLETVREVALEDLEIAPVALEVQEVQEALAVLETALEEGALVAREEALVDLDSLILALI